MHLPVLVNVGNSLLTYAAGSLYALVYTLLVPLHVAKLCELLTTLMTRAVTRFHQVTVGSPHVLLNIWWKRTLLN